MKCPHCGKETEIDVVQRWRESFVSENGEVLQLEELTSLPSPKKNGKYIHKINKKYGGPALVIVSKP